MAWLVRAGDVLAAAEVATSRKERVRGLLGRDRFDGAFVIPQCRQVHTIGMRFPIDVLFCSGDGEVVRVQSMRPWRLSPLVWRARFVVEARAGASERWRVRLGDRIEVVR